MLPITIRRAATLLMGLTIGLAGCASEGESTFDADEGDVEDVSSALPLAAVSVTGATFAGLGPVVGSVGVGGAGLGGTTFGTGATLGSVGTSVGAGGTVGPNGFSFGTGPMGFSTSTGPITTGTSFNTGPIGFSGGGGTTITSGTGMTPVISTTCSGFGCP